MNLGGKGRLRLRLVAVVLLAVLPTSGFVLYSGYLHRQDLRESLDRELKDKTQVVADAQRKHIDGAEQLLLALAAVPQINDRTAGTCNGFVADLRSRYQVYVNIGAANTDGDVYCSAVPLTEPVNISDRPYFQRAIASENFSLGDYQIGRISGKASLNFAIPLTDPLSRITGVVFLALGLDALQSEVQVSDLPSEGAFSIFDGAGRILAREPDPSAWVGKLLPEAPIVRQALERGSGTAEVQGLDGVVRRYRFRQIQVGGSSIYAAVGVPLEIALAEANRALRLNLIGLALGAVAATLAALVIGDALVGRLVRAEEDLARLGVILETTDDAVIGVDLDGRVHAWNPGAERLYGYPAKQVLGRDVTDLLPFADGLTDVVDRISQGGTLTETTADRRADGSEVETSKTVSAIRRSGEVTGISIIARDNTVQKLAERTLEDANRKQKEAIARLEEVDRLKSEFVGIVSHDLRSPMSVISGYARILQAKWADIEDDKKIEFLGAIVRTVDSAATLVSDTLEVSRIESGEIEMVVGPFSIVQLAQDLAKDLAVAQPGRRVEVTEAERVPLVAGDRERVRQVLTNLVGNALKFSPEGAPVDIVISAAEQKVKVEVVDRGIGIEPEDIKRVFDRFARVRQPGDQPKVKGTGLGLYICKRLVEAQSGEVWVESEVGRGSSFGFSLPAAP